MQAWACNSKWLFQGLLLAIFGTCNIFWGSKGSNESQIKPSSHIKLV